MSTEKSALIRIEAIDLEPLEAGRSYYVGDTVQVRLQLCYCGTVPLQVDAVCLRIQDQKGNAEIPEKRTVQPTVTAGEIDTSQVDLTDQPLDATDSEEESVAEELLDDEAIWTDTLDDSDEDVNAGLNGSLHDTYGSYSHPIHSGPSSAGPASPLPVRQSDEWVSGQTSGDFFLLRSSAAVELLPGRRTIMLSAELGQK